MDDLYDRFMNWLSNHIKGWTWFLMILNGIISVWMVYVAIDMVLVNTWWGYGLAIFSAGVSIHAALGAKDAYEFLKSDVKDVEIMEQINEKLDELNKAMMDGQVEAAQNLAASINDLIDEMAEPFGGRLDPENIAVQTEWMIEDEQGDAENIEKWLREDI